MLKENGLYLLTLANNITPFNQDKSKFDKVIHRKEKVGLLRKKDFYAPISIIGKYTNNRMIDLTTGYTIYNSKGKHLYYEYYTEVDERFALSEFSQFSGEDIRRYKEKMFLTFQKTCKIINREKNEPEESTEEYIRKLKK